jgi:large subunit ribosomal protein L18
MKSQTRYTVKYRRRREGKTDYKKRLELLKSKKDRLVIRKTNKQLILQVIRYNQDGDKVLVTVQSRDLKKHGWKHSTKNLPAAYLSGILLAKRASEKNISEAIIDLGLNQPLKGSRLFAAVKGTIDGGMKIPVNDKVFPPENRIKGEHISKNTEIVKDFESIKNNIMK